MPQPPSKKPRRRKHFLRRRGHEECFECKVSTPTGDGEEQKLPNRNRARWICNACHEKRARRISGQDAMRKALNETSST